MSFSKFYKNYFNRCAKKVDGNIVFVENEKAVIQVKINKGHN